MHHAIEVSNIDLTKKELEDSMQSLTAKLQRFGENLSDEERGVFTDIISSASESLSKVEDGAVDYDLSYSKPVQRYITQDLRAKIKGMTDGVLQSA